jgi:hypothetical protein
MSVKLFQFELSAAKHFKKQMCIYLSRDKEILHELIVSESDKITIEELSQFISMNEKLITLFDKAVECIEISRLLNI